MTGAAAVVRNMRILLRDQPISGWVCVVLDRFYSAVALAIQLLTMKVYTVGTIMPNRIGYDQNVRDKRQKRPKNVERGGFKFSRSVDVPCMLCATWMDSKPVHFISTGGSARKGVVYRRQQSAPVPVDCPRIVTDYHQRMGGVDVHDQLRLQRYSIQRSLRFRKYYKSLFFGLVDMAIVNAFITYKKNCEMNNSTPMNRAAFTTTLHNQLLQMKARDFENVRGLTPHRASLPAHAVGSRPDVHFLELINDWYGPQEKQKRRQRSCKVCSLHAPEGKKCATTAWQCKECTRLFKAPIWLCNKVQNTDMGKTCSQVWHEDYDNGENIPSQYKKKRILMRKTRATPGDRKQTRRELNREVSVGE